MVYLHLSHIISVLAYNSMAYSCSRLFPSFAFSQWCMVLVRNVEVNVSLEARVSECKKVMTLIMTVMAPSHE